MSYLERYDNVVRSKCETLSPEIQLRTGMFRKRDIDKAVALIKNPSNSRAYGKSFIPQLSSQKIEDILLKGSAHGGLRVVKVPSDPNNPNRPIQANPVEYDFSDTDSIFSDISPPASVVAEERDFSDLLTRTNDLYAAGRLTDEEFIDRIYDIRDRSRQGVEVGYGGEQIQRYTGRGEQRYTAAAYERPQFRTMGDLISEEVLEGEDPLSQGGQELGDFPPQTTTRRHMGFPVEEQVESDNRGSGSGQSNPNAPSWAAGGYSRGGSRDAYNPSREMPP